MLLAGRVYVHVHRFWVCTALTLALWVSRALGNGTTIAIYGAEPSPLMNATGDSYESWTGLEADVIRHLCGSGYLEDCTFFKVYDLDGRIDALINGSADVSIAGISVTAERAEKAQYVHPYYFEYNGFLYTDADGLQRITTYGDIEGKDVCVLQNSSYIGVLESQYGARVVPIDVREQAAEFIGNGSCVAWAGDPVFSFPKDVGLERVDLPPFTGVPMGAMVALDAPEYLVSSLQAGISSLFQDGQDSLILKYEDANLVEPGLIPGEGSILSQVEAISSFATPLEISQNVMNGSSAGVAAGDQFNVTIAVWTENLPPLANFAEGSFKAFLDPEGSSWSGIEVDLLQAICSKDTIVCNPDLVEVQTLDDRLNVLKNGSADISIGAITVTTDRLEQVPFVRPFYYSSGLGLFTDDENYEEFSGETEPGFLRGKNVCSQEGSAWTGFLDQYGATVVSVADQDAAIKAIKNGNCIAFAYDSFYAISGLKELPLFLPDTQLPYGIAMSQDAPSGLYSELVSTVIDGLSDGPDSFLLKAQEQESKTFNTAENPNLENVTDIITNLVVTQEQETSAEEEAVAPEENATESPIPIPSLAEENQSESSSTREILRLGRLIAVSFMMSAAFLL